MSRRNPIEGMPGGSVKGCIAAQKRKPRKTQPDDPGAYCAAIADRIEPGWRKRNPSGLTTVRVVPAGWTGGQGPSEAAFVFRGDRLVERLVGDRDLVTGTLLSKGYPAKAQLEIEVRPSEYARLIARRSNPNRLQRLARRLANGEA